MTAPPRNPSLGLIDTGIILGADGLGIVSLGEPVESAIETLSGLVGAPDSDEALTGPWPDASGCPGATGYGCVDYLRFVEWDGLRLVFTDGSPTGAATPPVLKGWAYSGEPGLYTSSGVSIGTTVEELQNIAGELLLPDQPDECTGTWMARIDGVGLLLGGDPTNPATAVTGLFAGEALGSC